MIKDDGTGHNNIPCNDSKHSDDGDEMTNLVHFIRQTIHTVKTFEVDIERYDRNE